MTPTDTAATTTATSTTQPGDPHSHRTTGRHAHFDTPDDDDADEADDEETLARQNAFRSAATVSHPQKVHLMGAMGVEMIEKRDENGSIRKSLRRFDELSDFFTRSERTRSERTRSERSHVGASSAKFIYYSGKLKDQKASSGRSVSFPDENLDSFQEIPELTEEAKSSCYMTHENWASIDFDVELTRKRWENHKAGSIRFDEENNCLRGLEVLLLDEEEALNRALILSKHQYKVLDEQLRMLGKEWDDERLRKVSLLSSQDEIKKARGRAIYDAEECSKLWNVSLTSKCNVSNEHDKHERYELLSKYEPSFAKRNNVNEGKNKNGLFNGFAKMFGNKKK